MSLRNCSSRLNERLPSPASVIVIDALRSARMSTQSCSTVSRGSSSIGPLSRISASNTTAKRSAASAARAPRRPVSRR